MRQMLISVAKQSNQDYKLALGGRQNTKMDCILGRQKKKSLEKGNGDSKAIFQGSLAQRGINSTWASAVSRVATGNRARGKKRERKKRTRSEDTRGDCDGRYWGNTIRGRNCGWGDEDTSSEGRARLRLSSATLITLVALLCCTYASHRRRKFFLLPKTKKNKKLLDGNWFLEVTTSEPALGTRGNVWKCWLPASLLTSKLSLYIGSKLGTLEKWKSCDASSGRGVWSRVLPNFAMRSFLRVDGEFGVEFFPTSPCVPFLHLDRFSSRF